MKCYQKECILTPYFDPFIVIHCKYFNADVPSFSAEAILFDKNFDISQIEMELCRSTESISMSMSQLLGIKLQKLTKIYQLLCLLSSRRIYLIFVLFSPRRQFFSTQKCVNHDKTDFATKVRKLQ